MTSSVAGPGPGFTRIRLTLGYDGTGFAGWARQPGLATVEGELHAALRSIDDRVSSLVVAGRTDAGVHARGQVVHVDLPSQVWLSRGDRGLVHQLNRLLDDRIHVRDAALAPPGFDARFSALSRSYSYRLCDAAGLWDPLFRTWVTAHKRLLDVAAMAFAAQHLLGEHDFAGFCKPRAGASTVRRLLRTDVYRDGGRRVVVALEADAFCHSMVRAIVGALVAVGEQRRDPEWIGQLLRAAERDSAVTVMPPQGLVLEAVRYPADELVAQRAQETRRYRGRDS